MNKLLTTPTQKIEGDTELVCTPRTDVSTIEHLHVKTLLDHQKLRAERIEAVCKRKRIHEETAAYTDDLMELNKIKRPSLMDEGRFFRG